MWKATVDGRPLTFRLIGINNQNFLMEDRETGSWWQQVSGEAIHGPLKGRRLTQLPHDEVTFGLWRREYPGGRVLGLDGQASQIRANWEEQTARYPVVVPAAPDEPLAQRALVIGLVADGKAKAYPMEVVTRARAVMDRVGETPVALLVGADGVSVRAFDRRVDGQVLDLLARPDTSPARFVDSQTGSEWDIAGRALSGPLAGKSLTRIAYLSDYWFDWKVYHPETAIYREWKPPATAAPTP